MTPWLSESLRKFRDIILFGDIFVIILTFVATTYFRFQNHFDTALNPKGSLLLIALLPFIWIIALTAVNGWETAALESRRLLTIRVISAGWRTFVFMAFAAYVSHDLVSRAWLFIQVISATILMILVRIATLTFLWKKVQARIVEKYLVIIAPGQVFDDSLIPPRGKEHDPTNVYITVEAPQGEKYHDWLEALKVHIKAEKFDGIIIWQGAVSNPVLLNEISHLYMLGISSIIMQSPVSTLVARLKPLPHAKWIRIVEPHLSNNGALAKRAIDIVLSAHLIVITSPIMLAAAIAIKLTSFGPVLYTAQRVGRDNALFNFPKFRTMHHNSDQDRLNILGRPDESMAHRYANDPRITLVGRFLRRWSIDELPQLFCVLAGTMSLVGPRPILPEELAQIQASDHYRFIAKPGLTGIWQISGRKEVEWQERMAQDTYYIENWNAFSDLIIIIRTGEAILTGKGAM